MSIALCDIFPFRSFGKSRKIFYKMIQNPMASLRYASRLTSTAKETIPKPIGLSMLIAKYGKPT